MTTDLEWQHLPVDSEEEGHGGGPGTESSHVTTDFLGVLQVVVLHGQVGLKQLHSLSVDCVLQPVHTQPPLEPIACVSLVSVLVHSMLQPSVCVSE